MDDDIQLQTRANKIFVTIQGFARLFPDEFEKCGIYACGPCDGTGLGNKHSMSQCNHCGGIGYKGYEKLYGEYVCRTCNGYGCDRCDRSGTVDWVKHAIGSDKTEGKWI